MPGYKLRVERRLIRGLEGLRNSEDRKERKQDTGDVIISGGQLLDSIALTEQRFKTDFKNASF